MPAIMIYRLICMMFHVNVRNSDLTIRANKEFSAEDEARRLLKPYRIATI